MAASEYPIARFLNGDLHEVPAKNTEDFITFILNTLNSDRLRHNVTVIDPLTEEKLKDSVKVKLEPREYYVFMSEYTLPSWVNPEEINWVIACENPKSIKYIEDNIHQPYLDKDEVWTKLSSLDHAISLLAKYPEKISWTYFSRNSSDKALAMMEKHPDKVNWVVFMEYNRNPKRFALLDKFSIKIPNHHHDRFYVKEAESIFESQLKNFDYVQANLSQISWYRLSSLTFPEMLPIFKENLHKVDKWQLSGNPIAISLLKEIPDCALYRGLVYNPHPEALELLFTRYKNEVEVDKDVVWSSMSSNPSAMDYLAQEPELVNYLYLSKNPSLFQ